MKSIPRPTTASVLLTKQRGVALFVSLVLLLVLTIIGVSSVQTTSLEVRMARNDHDYLLAFQAAESALKDAENVIDGIVNIDGFTDVGTNGLWTIADIGQPERWENAAVWQGSSSQVAASNIDGVNAQPRFIIEHAASVIREENAYQQDDPYAVGTSDRVEVFRITALGTGGSANAQVLLQSTYGRVLN